MLGINCLHSYFSAAGESLPAMIDKEVRKRLQLEQSFGQVCEIIAETREQENELRGSGGPLLTFTPFILRSEGREIRDRLEYLHREHDRIRDAISACEEGLNELTERHLRQSSEPFGKAVSLIKYYNTERVEPLSIHVRAFTQALSGLADRLAAERGSHPGGLSPETTAAYAATVEAASELDWEIVVYESANKEYLAAARDCDFAGIDLPLIPKQDYEQALNDLRNAGTETVARTAEALLENARVFQAKQLPYVYDALEQANNEFIEMLGTVVHNNWMRRLVTEHNRLKNAAAAECAEGAGYDGAAARIAVAI